MYYFPVTAPALLAETVCSLRRKAYVHVPEIKTTAASDPTEAVGCLFLRAGCNAQLDPCVNGHAALVSWQER